MNHETSQNDQRETRDDRDADIDPTIEPPDSDHPVTSDQLVEVERSVIVPDAPDDGEPSWPIPAAD